MSIELRNSMPEDVDVTNPEIRVSAKGRLASYVTYGLKLFVEQNLEEVTVRATGAALTTAVLAAETLKRRVKGLHQITTVGSVELDSKKEGVRNSVSSMEIKLSKKKLNVKDPGYQAPIDPSLVLTEEEAIAQSKERREKQKEDGKAVVKKGKGSKGKGSKGKPSKGKGKGKGKGKSAKGKGKSGGKGKGKKGSKGKGKGKKGSKRKGKKSD